MKVQISKPVAFTYKFIGLSSESSNYVKEGETVEFPSPLAEPIAAVNYPSGIMLGGATINVYHPYYFLNVAVSFITTHNTTGETLQEKTFMTTDAPTGVIRIPQKLFEVEGNRQITVKVINPENNLDASAVKDAVDVTNSMQIQISTGLYGKLEDAAPIYSSMGTKGSFNYYLYSKSKGDPAMLYLRVESGEADLYVRKSSELNQEYPDLDTYDYSSSSVKNDEIMLNITSKDPKDLDETEYYLIGVYCVTDAIFSLQSSTNPQYKFIKAEPGQVITETISPDYPLLISFHNPLQIPFKITATAAYAGVSVWAKPVDENKVFDFIDMVPDFQNEKPLLDTKQGHVIQKVDAPTPMNKDLKQWAFVVKPSLDDEVTFFIQIEKTALRVPIGTVIYDVLGDKDCQTYHFNYETAVFDESLKFSIESGSVDVVIADKNPSSAPKQFSSSYKFDSKGKPYSQKIQLSKVLGGPDNNVETPDAFTSFFVRVCSKSAVSLFELKTYKPSSQYYALKPSDRLIIDTNDEHKMYYYFVDEKTTSIRVKVSTRSNEKSEFTSQDRDVIDGLRYYFISNEGFGLSNTKGFNHNDPKNLIQAEVEYKPERKGGVESMINSIKVQKGYFIIKPAKLSSSRHLMRVQFLVNDYRLLPNTGNTFESIKAGQTYTFQITKPVVSVTSVNISACTGSVDVRVFEGDTKATPSNVLTIGAESLLNHTDIPFLDQSGFMNFFSDNRLIFIEVKTSVGQTDDALIVFNLNTYTQTETRSIEDFFIFTSDADKDFLKVIPHEENFDLAIKKITPVDDFDKIFKNFERVEIYYRLHTVTVGFPRATRIALKNKCGIEYTDSRFQWQGLVISEQKKTLIAKNGVFDWNDSSMMMKSLWPDGPLPYSVAFQLKMVFFGIDDDSDDDDSTLIFKKTFNIDRPMPNSIDLKKAFSTVVLITLILGLIVCAVVFWINRNRSNNPIPGKGFKPVQKENEMHHLRLESSNTKIENSDEKKQSDLDETV